MNITMHEAAKAWAEGKEVEWASIETFHSQGWKTMGTEGFCFNKHIQYRIKPEITTSLSNEELYAISAKVWKSTRPTPNESPLNIAHRAHRAVADAAIKQYIKEQSSGKEQTK